MMIENFKHSDFLDIKSISIKIKNKKIISTSTYSFASDLDKIDANKFIPYFDFLPKNKVAGIFYYNNILIIYLCDKYNGNNINNEIIGYRNFEHTIKDISEVFPVISNAKEFNTFISARTDLNGFCASDLYNDILRNTLVMQDNTNKTLKASSNHERLFLGEALSSFCTHHGVFKQELKVFKSKNTAIFYLDKMIFTPVFILKLA